MSKTLTLAPIKTSITVLFVFVLLFSCQKDALYTPSIKQQLIKKEAILELFNQMPVTTLLTPNWEEALQTNMNGSAVVRMPIKNVDRLKDLLPAGLDLELKMPANGKQMSLKTGSTNSQTPANGGNPNYFEQHPPELFIVRDPVSNKLNAYLLNFVPNDPNEDFGKDSIWTGKLYEWNLKGETVWVQEIEKNKLKDKYGLENPVVDNKNSISASGKILSLNDKKVSSFFGWFLDIVGDVVGWIADVLGFSTTYYYTNNGYGGGYRINWGTPGGAGEGGEAGFTGPVDRGGIYGSYIPGYSQGGGSYEPFPNNPGGPNPGSAVIPASTLYLISVLQLTDPDQMDFLATNSNISDELAFYLDTNGKTLANIAFATWAIGYLSDNDESLFSDLNEINNIQNSTINLPNLDVSQLSNYPAFKNLIENLPSFINNYPNILKALEYTTGFSPKKIKELMQPGKGPKVVVINNLKDNKGNDIVGHYDKNTKTIQIDNGYVDDLSAANTPVKYQAMGLMLIVATLHEFAHFGTNENSLIPVIKNRLKDPDYEPGWDFEGIIQPQSGPGYLQPSTAKEWLKYYKIKPRI